MMPLCGYGLKESSLDLPDEMQDMLEECNLKRRNKQLAIESYTIKPHWYSSKTITKYRLYSNMLEHDEHQVLLSGSGDERTVLAWLYGYINGNDDAVRLQKELEKKLEPTGDTTPSESDKSVTDSVMNPPACPVCGSNKSILVNLMGKGTAYSQFSCMDCDQDFNEEEGK